MNRRRSAQRSAAPVRRLLGGAGFACLAVAVPAALLAHAGGISAPADLLNAFLPCWLALGVIGYACIVVGRGWRGYMPHLLLAIVAITIVPALWAQGRSPLPAPPSPRSVLRLVQFNAYKDNATPEAAAAWIIAQSADIVTMQETLGRGRRVRELLTSRYPHQVSCLSRMRCSTVILSREAPLASGGLARGDPENRQTLSAVWARFARPDGPVTIVATHMVRPWPWGDQTRGREKLAAFLAGIDRRRTILAGDFNLAPWTVAMQRQDRLFGMPRLTRWVSTWPALRVGGWSLPPLLPIDHVYAGSDWRLVTIVRSPWLGSDHRGLSLVLADVPTDIGDHPIR